MPDIDYKGAIYLGVQGLELPQNGGGWALFSAGGGSPTLKECVLRPDATLVQTWSDDKKVKDDLSWTIPSYTTTSKTIHTGAALGTTYTLDYDYNYFVVEKLLLTPVYSSASAVKGKPVYSAGASFYELIEVEADTFTWGGFTYASRSLTTTSRGNAYRQPYYSSTSALGIYTSSSYGMVQTPVAPSVSSGKVTVSDPTMIMRGSTTYFTSSAWGTLTDIRRQYRIELWRSPKDNLNIDGWEGIQTLMHIINDAQGNGNLT